ncbi:MAG: hypothetical protein HYV55_01575 [Parcubacteria group bacterium]|nr:hypothetical protein [Parcubacteria group bacterium]
MIAKLSLEYLTWHFSVMPRAIASAWKDIFIFGLDYFSLPVLIKTLFSPWRRYSWSYPAGFQPAAILEALVSNFISRILGAIMRLGLIIIGACGELLIGVAGAAVFLLWLALLPLVILSFFYGVILIF